MQNAVNNEESKQTSTTTDTSKIRDITLRDFDGFVSDLLIFDLMNPMVPYSLERCL